MRITNKIMQGNALLNINNNKILQDKLNSQLITESKIVRPSDDPVIALRALRLRTNLSQLTQYYTKNIPDAKNWISITEEALKNITGVINDMSKQCTYAASGELTISDRQKLLEELKEYRNEIYATGNADFAGRSVFTGYRTDRELYFKTAEKKTYNITETFTNANIDKITYIDTYSGIGTGADILDANSVNASGGAVDTADITKTEIYRLRLAYDNLEANQNVALDANGNPVGNKISTNTATIDPLTGKPTRIEALVPEFLMVQQFDANGNPLTDATGRFIYEELGGTGTFTYISAKSTDNPSPYADYFDPDSANYDPDVVVFLADTGEVLLGENAYKEMMSLSKNQQVIVNYDKTDWKKGDLIPEHYFECTSIDPKGTIINYNSEYLYLNAKECPEAQAAAARQSIEYNIGFNQTLSVNVLGSECFKHAIGRDIDELISITEKTLAAQKVLEEIKELYKATPDTDPNKASIKKTLDAADKAYAYYQDYSQRMFEAGITKTQKHLDDMNIANTNLGSRDKRLDLVETRLMTQQTNYKTLAEDNEGIDTTEIVILLSSAQLSYEAALSATGKLLKTSLLDFI